eukprot:1185567-Prorocentrum_minimum.AAC.3
MVWTLKAYLHEVFHSTIGWMLHEVSLYTRNKRQMIFEVAKIILQVPRSFVNNLHVFGYTNFEDRRIQPASLPITEYGGGVNLLLAVYRRNWKEHVPPDLRVEKVITFIKPLLGPQ